MRIRLVHTQSLLLLAAVLLAVVSMGVLNAWNLRSGFAEFLANRDIERLEQFAAFVAENADRAGGINGLANQGLELRELLRRFARLQGTHPDRPLPSKGVGDESGALSIPRPPPTDKANAFRERVSIHGLDGIPLLGQGLTRYKSEHAFIERPVSIRGQVIATVRMVKLRPLQDDIETKFLKSQYASIAFVAFILSLIACACAQWVARRWVRPLLQIQSATDRISAGDFDFRLHDTRADEFGDVMRNVNRMAAELKELEGVRRQWIADISHELRTPLTVLRGEVDALIEGVRPITPQAVESLREEIVQLTSLVNDLHLLSMSDLKGLSCYFEEIDAAELVRKVIDRFSLRSKQLGLEIKVYVGGPSATTIVRWDSRRMGQLIGNLLDNSQRYTDAPGRITVTLTMNSSHALIDFDDSAPDVSDADLPRLFEPLYRADAARSRHSGGSGLGLAICAVIVQAHQGSIAAGASVLGGVQIHVELPRFVEDSK